MLLLLLHLHVVCTSVLIVAIATFLAFTAADVIGEPLPPTVTEPFRSQTVRDGDSVRFQCTITGNPRPNIAWFHGSKLIKPSPEFRQFYDMSDHVCSLDIREAFPEDTGRYTVVAKNERGTADCSADLSVCENEGLRSNCGYIYSRMLSVSRF